MTGSAELHEIFDRVYDTDRWTRAGNGSGPGSALDRHAPVVLGLRALIRDQNIQSIVDVSCGGMAWWPHVLAGFEAVGFHGFDVSGTVIQRNRRWFANRPEWQFDTGDARNTDYPKADLLVCRQTLNHLPLSDAVQAMDNMARATRILAVTSDPGLDHNTPDRRPLFDDCDGATCYARLTLSNPPFPDLPEIGSIEDIDAQVLTLLEGALV